MSQLSLFDSSPLPTNQYGYTIESKLARSSDKPTSQDAAADILSKLPDLQRFFVEGLIALGQPSTAREVAEHCRRIGWVKESESVRKRAKELVNAGVVTEAGERECYETGKAATLYWME